MRPVYEEKGDTIFKMSFHATNHPVQMHNHVWISSRALELAGCDPKDGKQLQKCIQEIYQQFFILRTKNFPNPENVDKNGMLGLLHDYCKYLKTQGIVQDYWVRLHHNDIILDSRTLKA